MAAVKKKQSAKGKRPPKKGLRGRMPVKRSINMVLVDENKINPLKAIAGILLIVLLATAFGKFMVLDRLNAVTRAMNRVDTVRTALEEARAELKQYDGIEDDFAHLTYADMTDEEMGRVDRVMILDLVSSILPDGKTTRSWSVTGNILSVNIIGHTLQNLNLLSRRIEESPIVDTCAISTAQKGDQKQKKENVITKALSEALEARREQAEDPLERIWLTIVANIVSPLINEHVQARLTIYLRQPVAPEAPAEGETPAEGAPGGDEGIAKKPSRTPLALVLMKAEMAAPEPEEVEAP